MYPHIPHFDPLCPAPTPRLFLSFSSLYLFSNTFPTSFLLSLLSSPFSSLSLFSLFSLSPQYYLNLNSDREHSLQLAEIFLGAFNLFHYYFCFLVSYLMMKYLLCRVSCYVCFTNCNHLVL